MAEQLADGGDQSNLLSLKWNNHLSNFKVIIASLQEKSVLSDATLACDGQLFPVHKLVLSTCSEFFGRVFSSTPCKHPVIVLQDLQPQHLHYLLSYMYVGEVNVPQAHLPTLIRAAETLQIKGLAAPDEEPFSLQGSTQSRLAKNQNQNDFFIPNPNTGRDPLNKLAVSNKSSAKRRRGFSVEHQEEITDCVTYSKDGGKENHNSGDNYEKRLNPLNVKRSRKADFDNCDTGKENTNIQNSEKLLCDTDVKEETLPKSSPIEQVGLIKEECDVSGSNDVTSLEEGMGDWADEQGAVDWACSSGQHGGSATALPWIPFSSPSSLSAQDCEDVSSIAVHYTSEFEPCIEDLPQRVLASVQGGHTSLQLPRTDYDARGSDQRGGRPSGGGSACPADGRNTGGVVMVGCTNSNNCITSDPQLLSVVERLPNAGEARREVLSSITSSNCSGSSRAEFSAQGVGRSRSIINSHNGFAKSSRSESTTRQSRVSMGSNSDTDLNNLLNPDTHFIGSEPNTLSSEIFSNIIGITGGGTTSKSGSGGGVVSTSGGLLHDCPVCPKTFQSRADVVRHLRTHTGERPFKCPQCQYRAALKGNLKSHILSRHTPDKSAVGALLNAASLPK